MRYRLDFEPSTRGVYRQYVREFYNDKAVGVTPDLVEVAAGEQRSGINAGLSVGGQISGVVTGVTGQPLVDVEVDVYVRREGSLFYIGSTSTDQQGGYTTVSVATGSYLLAFDPRFGRGDAPDHLSLYYNNKPAAAADPINVTAGQVTLNINSALAKGGAIQGQVTEKTSGQPLNGIYAYALLPVGSSYSFIRSAITAANGTYTLRGLATNTYRVEFYSPCRAGLTYETQYYNQQTTLEKANPVNITAPHVVGNINGALTLKAGSVIPPTPTPIPPQFLKNKVYLPVMRR